MQTPTGTKSPPIPRPRLAAIWLLAAGLGAGVALALSLTDGAGLGFLLMLAMVLGAPFIAQSRGSRMVASGSMSGFVGAMLAIPGGPADCGSLLSTCPARVGALWPFVVGVAITEAVTLLVVALSTGAGRSRMTVAGVGGRRARSGRAMISELERTLGIGVLIQAIDKRPPVTIDALLMYGRHRAEVTASGATEAEAWQDLAGLAVAWRNENDKQVSQWVGGGGV